MGLNFKRRNSRWRLRPRKGFCLPIYFLGWEASLMGATGCLLIMLCGFSPFVFTQVDNEGGTAAAIRALEHAWVDGQSRNDNHALDMIFDNAMVYVEYGKLVSKGEYLVRIRDAGPQLSQIAMESITVHTFGATAIVVGTYRERDVKGENRRVRRWRFVDTWVYKERGWVLVAAGAAPLTE
jgi:hypothetical protein